MSVVGDISGDGKITSADFLKLKSYFKGNLVLEGAYMKAADADGNGKLNSTDAISIKKYFTGRKLADNLPKMYKKYISKEILQDNTFSHGFAVKDKVTTQRVGEWKLNGDDKVTPVWELAQWNSGPCLWADRVDSGSQYILTDGVTKWVTYNPDDNSLMLRLNAAEVYKGQAAGGYDWPHLLIESATEPTDCTADRIYLSFDIKLVDYTPTTNSAGINACQFNPTVYLTAKDKSKFIWFGGATFDDRGPTRQAFELDVNSPNMIYSMSNANTFGTETQLTKEMGWVHVKVNIKPYIENCCYLANVQETYGEDISSSDFEMTGTNFGFEIHGNIDCTMAIRNYSLQVWNEDK